MSKRHVKDNFRKTISYLWHLKFVQFLVPDKLYIKLQYKNFTDKKLNFNNVSSFNEKIQWLKLYDRRPEYSMMVDKYEVREYISNVIGNKYLIPLLGVYNNFDEIDFDTLPNQFVLKPNHTSGDVYICKDKTKIDYKTLQKEIKQWLKKRYYLVHREWPYKNISPKIICEKYMVDKTEDELKDYKLMCFNGEVKCTFVCSNRNSLTGLNIDIYDSDWNLMPFERPSHPNSGILVDRPRNYKKMIKYAELLSKDIPFLRVDFYEINGDLYFSELTFYPGSGLESFKPDSYNDLLGSWLKLPHNNS